MPPQVRDFFEKIWPAVVDVSHPDVRDAAASALAAALELVAARPAFNSGYYCAIELVLKATKRLTGRLSSSPRDDAPQLVRRLQAVGLAARLE